MRRMNDEESVMRYFEVRAVYLDRGVGAFRRAVALFRMKRILRRYPCRSIPVSKSISPFTAPHGFHGIFISSGAQIAEGCTVFQQVTIGSVTTDGSCHQGAPTIGPNCVIGAGAKVIGGITVGENCRIGANCVVCEDVPPNSTVVLGKPRVIVRDRPMMNAHSSWKQFDQEDDHEE